MNEMSDLMAPKKYFSVNYADKNDAETIQNMSRDSYAELCRDLTPIAKKLGVESITFKGMEFKFETDYT
jgi:hypothetical protein